MTKPKDCVNNNCNNIFYVESYKLGLPLQCESCIIKSENKEKDDTK